MERWRSGVIEWWGIGLPHDSVTSLLHNSITSLKLGVVYGDWKARF